MNFDRLQREATAKRIIIDCGYGVCNSRNLYELKSVEGATSDLGNLLRNSYILNIQKKA